MEAAVKHLREGLVRDELGSAFVCVHDGLDVVGGRDVFIQLAQAFVAAVASGRAQAQRVVLLALEKSPHTYLPQPSQQQQQQQQQQLVTVLDAHASTHGWGDDRSTTGDAASTGTTGASLTILAELETLVLQHSTAQAQAQAPPGPDPDGSGVGLGGQPTVALIIDSVSHLFLHHPQHQVLSFLTRLRSHASVSCVLTSCHRDLHQEHVVTGVEYLSTCSIRLQALSALHREVAARHTGLEPHGCVSFRYKRRAGRVHVDSLLYTLLSSGELSTCLPPAALAAAVTAEALVALSVRGPAAQGGGKGKPAVAVHSGAAAGAQAGQVSGSGVAMTEGGQGAAATAAAGAKAAAGGMKLGLTEMERQAKQQVRLPYEHQGAGRQYETGDFRDYLPVPAGGHAGSQHVQDYAAGAAAGAEGGGAEVTRLGHILYTRDSEEEHDSDEDPDDDLDI